MANQALRTSSGAFSGVRRDGGKDELDGIAIGFGFERAGIGEARKKGLQGTKQHILSECTELD